MVDEVIKAQASLTVNGLNLVANAPTLILKDTSVVPTYSVGWYSDATGTTVINSANEGSTIYLVLKTTSIADGNIFTYSLDGINVEDLETGELNGTLVINNNIAFVKLILAKDELTENDETLTAVVKRDNTLIGNSIIVINDTSKTPTFAIGWYGDENGVITSQTINELENAYLVVKTTNIENGTLLNYNIVADGVNNSKLNLPISGTIEINNGIGYVKLTHTEDLLVGETGNVSATISYKGVNLDPSVVLNLEDPFKRITINSAKWWNARSGGTIITQTDYSASLHIDINSADLGSKFEIYIDNWTKWPNASGSHGLTFNIADHTYRTETYDRTDQMGFVSKAMIVRFSEAITTPHKLIYNIYLTHSDVKNGAKETATIVIVNEGNVIATAPLTLISY